MSSRLGAPRGRVQTGRAPAYDPKCGRPYRPGTCFQPANGAELVRMSIELGMSVSGLLDAMVEHLRTNGTAAAELVTWLQDMQKTGRPAEWPDAVTEGDAYSKAS